MKQLTAIFLLLVLVGSATAQLRFASLQEVLQYADKNSLVTQQSRLQQNISRKDEAINKSGLLPKINLFGTADYYPIMTSQVIPAVIFGGPADKYTKVQFGLPYSFSSGVEFSIPALNFEKWEQLKRYRLQSLQTDRTIEANKESLQIQLTQWYYQALLAAELVKLNHANQQVTDTLLSLLDKRKKNGVLNPADYNRSRNLQLDMRAAGVEYDKNYAQALIVLHQLLNLPDSLPLVLADSIAGLSWQTVPEAVPLNHRPGWKQAEATVAVAEQQLQESQKAPLPKIALNAKYTYQWQMKPSTDQHVNFDYSSVGLRLDFPLFQGSFYTASRQRSREQWQLAKLGQQQTANELTRQQSEWWNSYNAARKKDALLQEKQAVAADNLRIAQLNMKEGVMEFEEFNNIFQEYNKARMDFLQNSSDGVVCQLLLSQKW
ncbi:MAG TPA: TolC family protein [Chitinophagaceae bacterium]|nr:TolC family protein [Chitinophagaceae bacterium]